MSALLTGRATDDAAALDLQEFSLGAAAWSNLVDDASRGVCVLDADGVIIATNRGWLTLTGLTESASPASLAEAVPTTLADEVLAAARAVAASGRSTELPAVLRLQRGAVTLTPLTNRQVLAVFSLRAAEGIVAAAREAVDGLTARERDVLRLIGYGLSTADIAKVLHRSVKTIEWHRVALGNKLGVTNRVELARIAIAAGVSGLGPLPEGVPSDDGEKAQVKVRTADRATRSA